MTRRTLAALAAAAIAAGIAAGSLIAVSHSPGPAPAATSTPTPSSQEHFDDHVPMTTPGSVNTTLHVLRVTGASVDAVAGALPESTHAYTSLPQPKSGVVTVAFAVGTPVAVIGQARTALAALPGCTVTAAQQTWGAATLRAPLSGASPYVAAVGRDITAAASPGAVTTLNRTLPGGWRIEVDRSSGDLLLYAQAHTALTDARLDQLAAVLAAEAGAPVQLVRVVAGVPALDATTS